MKVALRDALIVSVPKRGNLQSCDNWRGISLLDVYLYEICPELSAGDC